MSLAPEIAPDVDIPLRARRLRAMPAPSDPLLFPLEPAGPRPLAATRLKLVPAPVEPTSGAHTGLASGVQWREARPVRLT
ncbi:MAG: hypothetical protein M3140_08000, partial [Actinomycetota bacterium]|nr:hypothetical protein [Actinomycetota bacterium]